jgi:hypothetical protein
MPTYDVTVGGVEYEVDAPDETKAWEYANYTHQQSQAPAAVAVPMENTGRLAAAMGNIPEEAKQFASDVSAGVAPLVRGVLPSIGTVAAGATAGALVGGPPGAAVGAIAAGLTEAVGDPLVLGVNKLFGTRLATPTEAWTHLMDRLEIPQSTTEAAKLIEAISRGGATALSGVGAGTLLKQMASPAAKAIGTALASGPIEQMVGGMGAGGGGEAARYGAEELGFGDTGQAIAGAVGSLAGGLAGARAARPRSVGAPDFNVPGMTPESIAQTVAEAEAAGRPVFTSDVFPPQTEAMRRLRDYSEGTLLGTAAERTKQQAVRQQFIDEVLQSFGAEAGSEFAADLVQNVKAVRDGRIDFYSGLKNQVLDRISQNTPPLQSPGLSRTLTTLTEEIEGLREINPEMYAPVIAKLTSFGKGLLGKPVLDAAGNITGYQGISLRAAEENLKVAKNFLAADQSLAHVKSPLEKIGGRLYGALKEDIKSTIRSVEGADAVSQYERANAKLAGGIKETKSAALRSALKSGDVKPETINNLLFSQSPSEVKLLYANLDPAGRAVARAAILSRAAEKATIQATGEISTAAFATQLGKLSKSLGVFFKGEDKQVIEGLGNYLKLTKRAEDFNVDSRTGARLVMPLIVQTIVSAAGGIKAGAATMATSGLLAQIFESPLTRKLLMALPRVKNNSDEQFSLLKRISESINADISNYEAERARNVQQTFLPENVQQEQLGAGSVITDGSTGYRILSKDGKRFGLYAPDNKRIGIFSSQEEAQKRAERENRKRK